MSDMDWANISDATPSLSWPPQPSHNITNDEIERLRAELAAAKDELAKVRQQRDIARREACSFEAIDRWHEANPKGILSPCAVFRIAREIAAKRGWVGLFKANEPAPREKEGGGA